MKKIMVLLLLFLFLTGWMIPESARIPVSGATVADWNAQSFWYYPWGRSGTHKGIDIFAKAGTPVVAATDGWVLYAGWDSMGGHVVWVLGPKWRWHYYAHLQRIDLSSGRWVRAGTQLGTVGSSGNAQGKAPHLHYAIRTLLPRLSQYDPKVPQAFAKMFYINPHQFLTQHSKL